jgi:hypothetical protein
MTKAEQDITTPTRRAALSGSVAALAGTALAVLSGRAVAAAGAAGTGASLSAGADPVLALWRQYVELVRGVKLNQRTGGIRQPILNRTGANEAVYCLPLLWPYVVNGHRTPHISPLRSWATERQARGP